MSRRSFRWLGFALCAALILLIPACCRESCDKVEIGSLDMKVEPPVANTVPHTEVQQDVEVQDPYFWLRDDARSDPEVLAYLEAENAYTEAVMKPTETFQQTLYDEMLSPDQGDRPQRAGPFRRLLLLHRTEEGKQYAYHCRKEGSLDAAEELLLDENALAEGHDYFRVGVFEVSPDHKLLAFSVDYRRRRELRRAVQESGHRRTAARRDPGDLLLAAVGRGQSHRLLQHAGRGAPALPALPARSGHRSGAGRTGLPGGRRVLLPRAVQDQAASST